jgi:hypothetical protein
VRPHVIVDALNVIGSRPNGWWRDRDRAVRNLVSKLQVLATADDLDLTVGIDGTPLTGLPEGMNDGVQLLYATRRGPNAADDRIIAFISQHETPASLSLVTADRTLTKRAEKLGALVGTPSMLLERLDQIEVAAESEVEAVEATAPVEADELAGD